MMNPPALAPQPWHLQACAADTSGAWRVWLAVVFAALLMVAAGSARAQALADDEVSLMAALDDARAGRASAALERLGALVGHNPYFRLAQLVYADLLLARAGRFGDFPTIAGVPETRLEELRAEAFVRVSHQRSRPRGDLVPAALLSLAPSQRRVVVVDKERSRLYVFENDAGQPRLIGDYYVSTGKKRALKEREGDQRTPVGVYFITTHLDAGLLDDFYGAGALPVNYPNEWDERHGRTGYGIWIHGVPSDTYSRPPRSSDGCIVLPNGDLAGLLDSLDTGSTPVIIAEKVDWMESGVATDRGNELRQVIEDWRRDLESRDATRHASHYAADFTGEGMNRAAWVEHAQRRTHGRHDLGVTVDELSLYAYPGERDLVVASFRQSNVSDNFSKRSTRRQYWRRDADGHWRIVHEGDAAFRPEHFRGIPWSARSRLTQLIR